VTAFVVVGAGVAGATAAAKVREEGFDGDLVLIGAESMAPYERPPLSKEYLRGESDHHFVRPPEWYAEHQIDARFGAKAERVNVTDRVVELEGGERVAFDQVVIATGARNRRPKIDGLGLPGVFDLRYAPDADAIKQAAKGGSKAVMVGMGFIGAEVAASLRQLGLDVTVVEFFGTPLERVLGPTLGGAIEALHRDHGVEMIFRDGAERFEGDGRFEAMITKEGRRIEGRPGRQRHPGRRHPGDECRGHLGDRRRRPARSSRIRVDPGRALRQRPEDGGARREEPAGDAGGVRRRPLVLVGPVRRRDPDGRFRDRVGRYGRAWQHRGPELLGVPAEGRPAPVDVQHEPEVRRPAFDAADRLEGEPRSRAARRSRVRPSSAAPAQGAGDMMQPNITHVPCDLNQQQKRHDARKDSLARAVAWRMGKRSWLDRLLRRATPRLELSAEDLRPRETEDAFHGFQV
jgi:thioredoxin reductase